MHTRWCRWRMGVEEEGAAGGIHLGPGPGGWCLATNTDGLPEAGELSWRRIALPRPAPLLTCTAARKAEHHYQGTALAARCT